MCGTTSYCVMASRPFSMKLMTWGEMGWERVSCAYHSAMSSVHILANCRSSDELEVQEALETAGGTTGYVRRISKPANTTKAPSKTPKPAGLSKPGKTNTPKPTGPSKPSKGDATKEGSLSKSGKVVEKVGKM